MATISRLNRDGDGRSKAEDLLHVEELTLAADRSRIRKGYFVLAQIKETRSARWQSVLMFESVRKNGNWFWTDVSTIDGAKAATRHGATGALVVATITAVFASISLFKDGEFAGIDPWAYLDAVAFAVLAFFVLRHSRLASVLALILYIFERVVAIAQTGNVGGIIMTAVFVSIFINAVRGSFAVRRLRHLGTTAQDSPFAPLA